MAENKIKVNELQTATPQLSDTLLASGAEREYACRISDLKDAIGGGGGGGDWNANEGEEGYIANRTHYTETTSYEHICTLPDDFADGLDGGTYYDNSPTDNDLFDILYDTYVADYKYGYYFGNGTITINDTAYECEISSDHYGDDWSVYFRDSDGNPYFEVYSYSNGNKAVCYNPECYIEGQNKTEVPLLIAHKLDVKYIPIQDLNIPQLNNIKDSGSMGGIIEGAISNYDANVASNDYTHAEGRKTTASGKYSHSEGEQTTASGQASHAEGNQTTASDQNSHAEGENTTASAFNAHAEGQHTKALGVNSHAEGGSNTTASGDYSHAEGYHTTASGYYSHAEGGSTTASESNSHAEGNYTTASGRASHAEGYHTTANHQSQHVFGEYNIADPSTATTSQRGNYVEIVGNGTHSGNLSNARTLDWYGNEEIAGTFLANGGILLKSPDGSTFTLKVGNDGTLTATKNT